jgi:hypothetical protein
VFRFPIKPTLSKDGDGKLRVFVTKMAVLPKVEKPKGQIGHSFLKKEGEKGAKKRLRSSFR